MRLTLVSKIGSRYYIEFQQIRREPTIFLISLRGGCTMMMQTADVSYKI